MDSCYDRLCYYKTQQNIKWWLIPLSILLVILAIVSVIILSLVVIPQVKANVADARLDTFSFTGGESGKPAATSFFSYNISLALAISNPNRAMSIRYTKPLIATIIFHDRRLHNLTVLDAGHRHQPGKTEVHVVHAGGEVPSFLLDAGAFQDFKKENTTGLFKVVVRLAGEITYQGIVIAKTTNLSISCMLQLQLAPPGPEVIEFHEVNCRPATEIKIYF